MIANVWLFILDGLTFETSSVYLISGLAIAIYTISESVSLFEKKGVKIDSVQRD